MIFKWNTPVFCSILFLLLISGSLIAQCPDCGNSLVDTGETNLNCPQDVAHGVTCTSPCAQPTSFESTVGIRESFDFVGTTTFSSAGLPAGWNFASAPTATTAGTLAAAGTDTYGAKGGLVQPNCSGSCAATNGFCIGNMASSTAVGTVGTGGKLGANFDGRPNINQNLSYAVLRGQNNPTLVSPTYNMNSVNGFKVQFWLFPSESSCGQTNGWGSCVGNVAYLDFSSNGGTSWTQVLTMDLSSSNSDMCTNNSTNTLWLNGSSWSRVCLTVFRNTSAEGNFYPAAGAGTAASGMMVNSAYFTSTFKFRIRYAQTASCTAGITATNPGRYLAIDYPVITSGNEMIPCGISFSKMCGYGEDNNDEGVGSVATTSTLVFGTVRRGVNNAERGVEILTSQNSSFASQNLSGSTFATNYDLCNAEGGDRQCIDWQPNNNFYIAVYECVTDWEAATGTINLNYYKGTTPQSTGMTKVTLASRTALIGWRYSANRFVSCSATSDLNPGCNGYLFRSSALPTQFSRGFYTLAVNSTGQAWPYYGASSCNNYFNGPFFAPIATPDTVGTNFVVCSTDIPVFSGLVDYCFSGAGMAGDATITVTGPNGFTDIIVSGDAGTEEIVDEGEYIITASPPNSPAQCVDCSRSVCVTITAADLDICTTALPVGLINFNVINNNRSVEIRWSTVTEINNDYFEIQRSVSGENFETIKVMDGNGNSSELIHYNWTDPQPLSGRAYYRIKQVDFNGEFTYSTIRSTILESDVLVYPNPTKGDFVVTIPWEDAVLEIFNLNGDVVTSSYQLVRGANTFSLTNQPSGCYIIKLIHANGIFVQRLMKQ